MRPLILANVLALPAAAILAQSLPLVPRFEVASVRVVPSSNGLPEGFAIRLVHYTDHVSSWRMPGTTPEQLFLRVEALTDAAADIRCFVGGARIETRQAEETG